MTDDDWQADVTLEPVAAPPPKRKDKDVLSQYTKNSSLTSRRSRGSSGGGFFGPEKKGLDAGVIGGLAMMGIATVWFIGGLAMGILFYYPPILFVIGLFGFLRGMFSGNVSGR